MTTRADIVEAAKSYIGVRFRHRGRDRLGLDCVGLLVAVSSDIGEPVVDNQEYKRISDAETFRDMLLSQSIPSAIDCIADGSIVLIRQAAYPCHCGIVSVTGERCQMLIHASIFNRKVMIEPLANFMKDLSYVRDFKGLT